MTTLHSIAGPLAAVGVLGTVHMALYKAALRRLDRDLIPASAMPRVRWWSAHVSGALTVTTALAVVGLLGLLAT
ncbi:hypothetical protein [Streptomyces carpinensis]|uniref:Integral membrane protein n=1 Tax=Streptomyces carpinensis TaxID=66369 RepID=A0ABV1W8B7_9ACTN|nr:hypothetical protein [Streptomyces carpinensis]